MLREIVVFCCYRREERVGLFLIYKGIEYNVMVVLDYFIRVMLLYRSLKRGVFCVELVMFLGMFYFIVKELLLVVYVFFFLFLDEKKMFIIRCLDRK